MSENELLPYLKNLNKIELWDVSDFAPDAEAYRSLRDRIKHHVENMSL